MNTEKNTVLPSVPGPIIQKNITIWPDGQKAQTSFDVSNQLFCTLQDYNTYFTALDTSYSALEQIATKETKEYKKMKASIQHELQQLKELMQQTHHYKALLLMEDKPIILDSNTEPKKGDQNNEDLLIAQAHVILAQKGIALNTQQIGVLDKYYKSILQNRITSLQQEKVIIKEKAKTLIIQDDLNGIIDHLFETMKKPAKKDDVIIGERVQNLSLINRITKPFRKKESPIVDKPLEIYKKSVGVVVIKNNYQTQHFILEFSDTGHKIKDQLIGKLGFVKTTETEANELGTLFSFTIDNSSYIEKRMK